MFAFLSKDSRRGRTLHTFAGACAIPLGNCNRNYPSESAEIQVLIVHRWALGDIAHAVSTRLRQQMGYVGEASKTKSKALVPGCWKRRELVGDLHPPQRHHQPGSGEKLRTSMTKSVIR